LQSPRREEEIQRRLAAIVYEVGSGTPDLAEQLADVDHPDLAIVRALLSTRWCARAIMPREALAHYIQKTQRFLEDPVIEELLWHVEQTLLLHRHLTGPALTQILESLAPPAQGFPEDAS
jgi:hypothetical protein